MKKVAVFLSYITALASTIAAISFISNKNPLIPIAALIPLVIAVFFVFICRNTKRPETLDHRIFIFIGMLIMVIFSASFITNFFGLITDSGTAFLAMIILGSTVPLSVILLILGIFSLKTKSEGQF